MEGREVSNYKVKMEVTGHPSVNIPAFEVKAHNETSAIDAGFDRAFAEFAQFGSFTCVDVELLS
jgi:hypothetical protein